MKICHYWDTLCWYLTICYEDGRFGILHHNMGIPVGCTKQYGGLHIVYKQMALQRMSMTNMKRWDNNLLSSDWAVNVTPYMYGPYGFLSTITASSSYNNDRRAWWRRSTNITPSLEAWSDVKFLKTASSLGAVLVTLLPGRCVWPRSHVVCTLRPVSLAHSFTLKMKAIESPETLVNFYLIT
jgi:hypothetical protein